MVNGERVRKHDGRVVPFRRQKLSRAIGAAARAAGEPDSHLAAELAHLVALSLSKRHGVAAPLEVEVIRGMVRTVLTETGQASIARAYALHRASHVETRAALRVRTAPRGEPRQLRLFDAGADHASWRSWSRSRLARGLARRGGLEETEAFAVAKAVENRIVRSGLRLVTTGLIREFADNELFTLRRA